MRIEKNRERFMICRGREREAYFCFFVDNDKSAWSTKCPWGARTYASMHEAQEDLTELRNREKLRRRAGEKL